MQKKHLNKRIAKQRITICLTAALLLAGNSAHNVACAAPKKDDSLYYAFHSISKAPVYYALLDAEADDVTPLDKNNNAIRYLYFPADTFGGSQESMISDAGNSTNEMLAAYFSFARVPGFDVGISSVSQARYYYSIGSADVYDDPVLMLPIADAETYEGVGSAGSVVSSITHSRPYHFYIPKSVVNLLAEHTALRIYFEVTTTYTSGETNIVHGSVELRKIGLLPLK